jgi:hypothetical protein
MGNQNTARFEAIRAHLSAAQVWQIEMWLLTDSLPEHLQTLLDEKWVALHPPKIEVPPTFSRPKSILVTAETESSKKTDWIVKKKEELSRLYKQRANLHASLELLPTDMERREVAQQMLCDIMPKMEMIFEEIEHYNSTGETSEELNFEQQIIIKAMDAARRKRSIETDISQCKKRYEIKKDEKELKRVPVLEKELQQIKIYLDPQKYKKEWQTNLNNN